jgi:S1-C subfamily serine protease
LIGEIVMMRLAWLLGALLLAGVVTPSALAKGPIGIIRIGDWKGGAFTNDQTGTFANCVAVNEYRNGTALIITQYVSSAWFIAFVNDTWNATKDETLSVALTFDGRGQARLFARVGTPHSVFAVLPNAVLQSLRKSQLMAAQIYGQTTQFPLGEINHVIATISNCVTKAKVSGVAATDDFSTPAPAQPYSGVKQGADASPAGKPAQFVRQTGTGFVISSSGHIVTNNHVIDGCVGDIHGSLTGESDVVLRVVATDELNDLALVKAAKSFNEVARIRAAAIHSGDTVIAIGYPFYGLLTSDFTVTTGIVSSLSGLLNDTRYLQISAAVQSGNSGGPLLDTSGNVVGVVAAKLNALKVARATGDLPENINFAIKTGVLRDFLDNSAVSCQTADSVQERKTADIAAKARGYTMLISCSAKEREKK